MNRICRHLFFLLIVLFLARTIAALEGPILEADLMILEEETGIITCEGNVYLEALNLHIRGDFATFRVKDLSFSFSGAVSMNYDDLFLTSQELEGHLERENLLAKGQVEITYPSSLLKGDLFQLKAQEEKAFMEGGVEFFSEMGDLFGDRMEWDLDFSYLQITGSAQWTLKEIAGRAKTILFKDEDGVISLSGEAFVDMEGQSFYGDDISYFLHEGRIRIINGGIKLPPLERD